MLLLLLVFLAGLPLLGIVGIAFYASLTTVDGLFTSLILLTISGIFGMTALAELKRMRSGPKAGTSTARAKASAAGAGSVTQGKVQDVVFFEANVGEPNKSIVTLSDGSRSSQILVLSGDVRNALPVGQKVAIIMRKEGAHNVLVDVSYA